jgi:tetratricopeptide (TPR) repeat protein/ferredoxin
MGPLRTGSSETVHLPQLKARAHPTLPTRPRRFTKWRVGILIAVHVLILAHIVQWKLMGTTVAPLVAAESMYTLEQGQLNNGFLIFAAVLLMTLVAGRFLCGWACHMGGLQLFTAWLLRKVGIRPRLFRARLLGYMPLVFGLYMFVWPSFTRWIAVPLLERPWPAAAACLRPTHPFPGWSVKFMTHDLWENLPSAAVAFPFLLVCGAATVYFLGARGFCRYGCPYGGIMQRVEQLAPGRVVVDKSKCDECGICTAACGSGVRVLDELKAYGRVVNKLCTRSLDCVDVCPTKALSFGWGAPAILKRGQTERPRELYDLHWGEELLILAAFGAAFFISRGLYGRVPMLMAVGIALCAAFIVWKAWRLLRDRNARFGPLQLKLDGRLRPAGLGYLAFFVAFVGLGAHSAAVQTFNHLGSAAEDRVTISRDAVFSGDPSQVPTPQREAAIESLRWYQLGGSLRRGGIGLADTPEWLLRTSWLNLVAARPGPAEDALARYIDSQGPSDVLVADLAQIMRRWGNADRARTTLERHFATNPGFARVRDMLASTYVEEGRVNEAEGVYQWALAAKPTDGWARTMYGQFLMQQGRPAEALSQIKQATVDEPRQAGIRQNLALALFNGGDVDGALAELKTAAAMDSKAAPQLMQLGAEMLSRVGRADESAAWAKRSRQKE